MMWRNGWVAVWVLATWVLGTGGAQALWGGPADTVPVERLLENLGRQLDEHPDSHRILAQIARVHSRAYALECGGLPVSQALEFKDRKWVEIGPGYLRLWETDGISFTPEGFSLARITPAQRGHLQSAIEFYTKATEHKEADAYDWLGLGYTLREAARIAELIPPQESDAGTASTATEERRTNYLKRALAAYWKAFHSLNSEELQFYNAVIDEASQSIVEILSTRKDLSDDPERELKMARRRAKEMSVAERMITPIIFHLTEHRSLQSLLAPVTHVTFDLDGSDSGLTWPWVQPDTAILVWDESGDRNIPNGCSLIGSVTWWLFWETGYDVLNVLDNDQSGWLEGTELQGLGVWQDWNGNGVSDPGEVRSLDDAGVTGIAASATDTVADMPSNLHGLRMQDGRVLPTYDWITGPVTEASP